MSIKRLAVIAAVNTYTTSSNITATTTYFNSNSIAGTSGSGGGAAGAVSGGIGGLYQGHQTMRPGAALHGNVNVLLGGAMLSVVITVVCVVCYCCHRNIKKRTASIYRQRWLENDANMEIYSVEQCYETSGLFAETPDTMPASVHINGGPPPSYEAVVAMDEMAARPSPPPGYTINNHPNGRDVLLENDSDEKFELSETHQRINHQISTSHNKRNCTQCDHLAPMYHMPLACCSLQRTLPIVRDDEETSSKYCCHTVINTQIDRVNNNTIKNNNHNHNNASTTAISLSDNNIEDDIILEAQSNTIGAHMTSSSEARIHLGRRSYKNTIYRRGCSLCGRIPSSESPLSIDSGFETMLNDLRNVDVSSNYSKYSGQPYLTYSRNRLDLQHLQKYNNSINKNNNDSIADNQRLNEATGVVAGCLNGPNEYYCNDSSSDEHNTNINNDNDNGNNIQSMSNQSETYSINENLNNNIDNTNNNNEQQASTNQNANTSHCNNSNHSNNNNNNNNTNINEENALENIRNSTELDTLYNQNELASFNDNGIIRLDMSRIIDKTGLPTYEAALTLESSGYV